MSSPIGTPSHESVGVAHPSTTSIKSIHGAVVKAEDSSLVGNPRPGGLSGTNWDRIYPRIEFWKRQEFYLTVGRVQNVVESYVLDTQNREHYYDQGKNQDEEEIDEYIKLMEQWEESIKIRKWIGTLVRNWLINGVNIFSEADWEFVQLQSIQAKRRDMYGKTTQYIQIINGREIDMDATGFIEVPYIDLDREPWGVGQFDSLMNRDYIDIDGRTPIASLELYRQALQDNMKIHHKFASPRVIYSIPNANEETIDNDIVPIVEGMHPGDRAVFNEEITISQETVDGNARFIEHVNKIIDEVDTGLQSSANRVIAEPSAMADARAAGSQDDDRTLGIMARVAEVMNDIVIPKITGLAPGQLVWKWGSQDTFGLEFPEPLEKAIAQKIIRPEQAMVMLEEQFHWKIPSMDEVEEKLGIKIVTEEPEEETPEEIPAEMVRTESTDIDNQIKVKKLEALEFINTKLQEED